MHSNGDVESLVKFHSLSARPTMSYTDIIRKKNFKRGLHREFPLKHFYFSKIGHTHSRFHPIRQPAGTNDCPACIIQLSNEFRSAAPPHSRLVATSTKMAQVKPHSPYQGATRGRSPALACRCKCRKDHALARWIVEITAAPNGR